MNGLRIAFVVAATALVCLASAVRADVSGVPIQRLFAEGNAKFREALAAKDKPAAQALYAEAIARWRAVAEQGAIRNAKLYSNIGNACLLSGDTGRAVVNFERAKRLDPSEPAAVAGLEAARREAAPATPPTSVAGTIWERTVRYAGYLPRRAMLGTFAGLWILGWTVLGIRIMGYAAPARLGPALLAAGVILAVPVVGAEVLGSRLVNAVIIAAKAPAYNGPSDAIYQPTFKDGLPAGIEVRLIEHRGEWRKVRLGDGRETWVRAADLERI